MTIVPVLKQAVKIAGKIDRKYNLNKIFIQKYVPPGYRTRANKIVDIAGSLGGGYGIVRFVESLYAIDSPGNSAPIQQQRKQRFKTSKSYKTRRRRSIRCPTRSTSFKRSYQYR